MEQFKLGPLQTQWIQSLREHPERQTIKTLGKRLHDGTYRACCLGEAGLIAGVCFWSEFNTLSTVAGDVNSSSHQQVLDNDAYKAMGLKSPWGHIRAVRGIGDSSVPSLSWLNDHGKTWPQIADIIMQDPSQYFTESK